ncbi:MAG: alpha-ketoacid dehydrogenase subunit beta [Rhodospirillaceae bacterium]|jgi:acetoin:2,6-dichlorophenolindophenol oxidoreductase subunit beta|nr:alpha-ketoacid dehydrogenase subunit beta [Rhodospirillaceae bacterium]MBT4933379.1 alpha-ketoacid dehydrogenase subunit beta [Rhodospirillaceae bacterium]MBT5242869.1 alpha-ketoacid dehydrogenase subunit beta [Rhodospirillaceae bacterium]MBT5563093.1 alpha-ketoacid dehydrogenase subunit beta [Rhodospirillaceae bacterium]MBT6243408.1 alpha-ketoacid dehydrogenase subunit beta [Rhodospirillaceae bacterium]
MSTQNNGRRLLSYGAAVCEAVAQEMALDEDVFVMGLDVDDHTSIQGSVRGLLEKFGPERIFGTPLSEDAMTGVAIGAAMAGMRPVHVHIRMDFMMLAMNQLINMAAKSHYMYGGTVTVPLVVRSIIGKSWGQGPQHSQALYSMFAHVPGLKLATPSNAHDAKGCMIAAIRDNNPVVFTEHRLLYYTEAYVPTEPFEVKPGKARVCTQGDDITLVGISNMVIECLRVNELLADEGITVEVIDPIWLVPLDIDTIVTSAKRTKRLLIVDNAWKSCGMSAEILAAVSERSTSEDGIVMARMGFAPTPCPTTPSLEDRFYPNPRTIAAKAFAMVRPDARELQVDREKAQLAYQSEFKGPF